MTSYAPGSKKGPKPGSLKMPKSKLEKMPKIRPDKPDAKKLSLIHI